MTAERVDYRAQITALLPAHAHHVAVGLTNLFGGLSWTWTTPDGSWTVVWGGIGGSAVVTPFGRVELRGGPDVAYRRLIGVLIALGGIESGG
jgi:hypothetical protein